MCYLIDLYIRDRHYVYSLQRENRQYRQALDSFEVITETLSQKHHNQMTILNNLFCAQENLFNGALFNLANFLNLSFMDNYATNYCSLNN